MKENKKELNQQTPTTTRLKVVHQESGKFEVFFPFSDVPVVMTPSYFQKNVNPDKYIIDFDNDFDHHKAG